MDMMGVEGAQAHSSRSTSVGESSDDDMLPPSPSRPGTLAGRLSTGHEPPRHQVHKDIDLAVLARFI
jgi:hypothetical protein